MTVKTGTCFLLAAALLLAGCGRQKDIQNEKTYPAEAVEIVAPAGPGSGYDITAHSLAQALENGGLVDVPLPVTNLPGNGGGTALRYLSECEGRNDVVSVFSPPLCLIFLNGSTDLNYKENTTPIAKLAVDYGCIAVRADSPYGDLPALMEALRADPQAAVIGGTSAEGSLDHIQFLKAADAAGVTQLKEIVYRGFENGGAAAQLMGRQVDVLSVGLSDVAGLMESGEIRVLAVMSQERLPGSVISQIPTCREQGIDVEFAVWRGLFGPKNMPEEAVSYWQETLKKLADSRDWIALCREYGWTPDYQDGEEFKRFLSEVNEEYRELLAKIYN